MAQGGGSGSSKQFIDPTQLGFLSDIWGQAQGQAGNPFQYAPNTIAQTPGMTASLEDLYSQGIGGDAGLEAAQGLAGQHIGGEFLGPGANPYTQGQFDRAAGSLTEQFNTQVLPSLEGAFGGSGRIGGANVQSGAYQNAISQAGGLYADSLAGAAGDIFGGEYQGARGQQQAATQMAPGLAAADYQGLQAAGGAAGQLESRDQQLLNDIISRWDFAQNEPWERIGVQQGLLGQPANLTQGFSGNNKGGGIVR